jgi:hypothetical protein
MACWDGAVESLVCGSDAMILAPLDRRSENIRILTVIVSELELGDIQRHILAAHFVKRADHAALENRPEALDGLSVDRADNVLASRMVNGSVREILVEAPVQSKLTLWETVSLTNAFSVAA